MNLKAAIFSAVLLGVGMAVGGVAGWRIAAHVPGAEAPATTQAGNPQQHPQHKAQSGAPCWRGPLADVSAACAPPLFTGVAEIILVVEDLEASVARQWETFGIGPWEIWTFDSSNVKDMVTHGERKDFSIRIAYTRIGDTYWELVQPLDEHSTYYETLRDHGEGVHNIVFSVDDFDQTVDYMQALGVEVYNSGDWQGLKFINFDTRDHLPVIAEIYRATGEPFPEPEAVYP